MKKTTMLLGMSALLSACDLKLLTNKAACEVIVRDTIGVYNNKRVLPEKIFSFCDTALYMCERPTDTAGCTILRVHFDELKDSVLLAEKEKAYGAYLVDTFSLNLTK